MSISSISTTTAPPVSLNSVSAIDAPRISQAASISQDVADSQNREGSEREADAYIPSVEAQRFTEARTSGAIPEKEATDTPQHDLIEVHTPEDKAKAEDARASKPKHSNREDLTPQEEEQLKKLEERDKEVRIHEQAHLQAAGPYGKGPPTYEYQEGPDGKQYAIGGHVHIDANPIPGDPEATIQKARVVYKAALAPKEPSPQDRKVAAEAKAMESKAQQEVREHRQEELRESQAEVLGTESAGQNPFVTDSEMTESAVPDVSMQPASEATSPLNATLTTSSLIERNQTQGKIQEDEHRGLDGATNQLVAPREPTMFAAAATYASVNALSHGTAAMINTLA